MDCDSERIDDLLPKKPTIGKRRRKKSKATKTKEPVEAIPKEITLATHKFEEADPFANAKTFVSFYRSIVASYAKGKKVDFPSHGADRQYASSAMDDLIDSGRDDDVEFLREWIKYYAEFKLKGDDFENYNKTSVRSFSKTLDEYKQKHIDL